MNPADWKAEGLCAQVDPDLWFPGKGNNCHTAKAICRRCPVQFLCLQYGLHEEHGIWGGMTRTERRRYARRQRMTEVEAA